MDETRQAEMAAAMDALWAKFLPQMEERLAVLEAANRALASGELSAAEREAAHAAAHKLAGYAEHLYLNAAEQAPPAERLQEIVRELRQLIRERK